MKIKWKCIFYNLVIPIIVAITLCAIVMLWVNYEVNKPVDYNETIVMSNLQTSQYPVMCAPSGGFGMMSIGPFIILSIIAALLITCIRGMLKPCVIIENGIADNIAMGLSAIGELIAFSICIGVGLIGVVAFILDVIVIKSLYVDKIATSTCGPEPIGVTIIMLICFGISYSIYWFNKNSLE